MALQVTVPNAGETTLLDWLVRAALVVPESLWLRLFTNAFTPGHGTVTADFTEANFAGYSPVLINRGDWAAPTLSGNDATVEPIGSPFTFACTSGSQSIAGVYLTGGLTLITYYCRAFDAPFVVDPLDPLSVRPVIALSSPAV